MFSSIKKLNKIRNKLLIILLLTALFPMLFLGIWASYSVKKTRVENIQELEKLLALQLDSRLKKFVDDKIETYRINIADPNVNAIGHDQQKFILNGLMSEDHTLEEASFINILGQEETFISRLQATGAQFSARDLKEAPTFKTALEKKDYLGEVNFSESIPWMFLASPVVNQKGDVIAILQTKVRLDEISEMIQGSVLGEKGYSYITDQTDRIVGVSGRLGKELINTKINNSLSSQIKQQETVLNTQLEKGLNKENVFISGKNIPSLNWTIFIEWPKTDALKSIDTVINNLLIFTIVLTMAVIFLSLFLSRSFLKPLAILKEGTDALSKKIFAKKIEIKTNDEFEDLGSAFNSMAEDLNRFYEIEKEKQKTLKTAFGQYAGSHMVEDVLKSGKVKLGGERKYITVLFSDIQNFTTISEKLEPEVLVKYLNQYLTAMTDIVIKHGGTIDKYIGDAILAFWGAPITSEDHAYKACLAAEEMIATLKEIQKDLNKNELPELNIRIGINTGGSLVGNVGSEQRLSYTVIGDVVNLAARLESLNKQYGTNVMISHSTCLEIKSYKPIVRELDKVIVKGKTEGVKIYEFIALKNEVDHQRKTIVKDYAKALELYRERKWESAIKIFAHILELNPNDGPSRTLMARAQTYDRRPPEDINWDGTYKADEK